MSTASTSFSPKKLELKRDRLAPCVEELGRTRELHEGVQHPDRAARATIGGQLAKRVPRCVGKWQVVTPSTVPTREAGAVQMGARLA